MQAPLSEPNAERIEEGLTALRRDRDEESIEHFTVSDVGLQRMHHHHLHHPAPRANFDDLFRSREFLKRAMEEELPVPFDAYCTSGRRLPPAIEDEAELFKLGISLCYAGEQVKQDKETVLACVKRNAYDYHYLSDKKGSLFYDKEVMRVALQSAFIMADLDHCREEFTDFVDTLPKRTWNDIGFSADIAARYGVGPLTAMGNPKDWVEVAEALRSYRDRGPGPKEGYWVKKMDKKAQEKPAQVEIS